MDLDFDLDALERLLSEAEPSAPWRETKYGIITDDGTGTCVVSWDYAWGDAEGVAEGTLKPLIVAAVNALRALITRLRAAEDALRAIARGDARDVLLPQEGDRPPMANARDYFSGIVEANRWLKERLPDYDDSDVPALIVARAMLIDLNAERDAVLRAAEARAAQPDPLAYTDSPAWDEPAYSTLRQPAPEVVDVPQPEPWHARLVRLAREERAASLPTGSPCPPRQQARCPVTDLRTLAQAVVDAWQAWFDMDTSDPDYERLEMTARAALGKAVIAADMTRDEAVAFLRADAQGYARAMGEVVERCEDFLDDGWSNTVDNIADWAREQAAAAERD